MKHTFPEDLFSIVIDADRRQRQAAGEPSLRFKPSQRRWLEPIFNVLGLLAGVAWQLAPARHRERMDLWLCRKIGQHGQEPCPELPNRISETMALARKLRQDRGQWPGMLVLTSHPLTEGPLQWLRFELLAQGLQAAFALTRLQKADGAGTRVPECGLAIDPYALDSVPVVLQAFYAAFMHQTYLVFDRQPATQSWIQRQLLLRRTENSRIGWRLLQRLRSGIPVAMALAGGVPFTARLLYTTREWVNQLPVKRWPMEKRDAERKVMTIVAEGDDGFRALREGSVSESKRQELSEFLKNLSLSPTEAETAVSAFVDEFKREIPYRDRFFSAFIGRLHRAGRDLLVLPVMHRQEPPHVYVSSPRALRLCGDGSVHVYGAGDTRDCSLRDAVRDLNREWSAHSKGISSSPGQQHR